MCKHIVMMALGVLLIAFGASSFWYSVLGAITNHALVSWSSLFAYALSLVVGIGLAVMGGFHHRCTCGCGCGECGCGMGPKKGKKR